MRQPETLKSETDKAFRECEQLLADGQGLAFIRLLQLRLEMHKEALINVPVEKMGGLQGRAMENSDILRKLGR